MEDDTEIFSTGRGVLAVKSPVKRKILHMVSNEGKTGGEIRDNLGKAKSTISVHLSDLEELGLIEERVCPSDGRKKIYSLSGDLLGRSEKPSDVHFENILAKLRKSSGDSYKFLKNLFHLIRYGFGSLGMNVGPALKEMGREAGESLAKDFQSEDIPDLLEEIKSFWKDNKLGEIEIEEGNCLTVHDCFDCAGAPEVGSTICSLDEGMLEGIIEERTGKGVSIRETECFGTGKDHCRFEMIFERK